VTLLPVNDSVESPTHVSEDFIITVLTPFSFLWSPYVIGQTVIFLPCDFYLLSSFSSFFPRLISAVGDWMSTIHGVALMRIQNAGLKPAARGLLKTGRKKSPKVAKNRHLGTIAQLCRAISSQRRHVSTIGKKLVKQQYLLYMS